MDGGGLPPGYRKGWLHQEGVWEAEGGAKTASDITTTNALRGWWEKEIKTRRRDYPLMESIKAALGRGLDSVCLLFRLGEVNLGRVHGLLGKRQAAVQRGGSRG